MDKPVSIAVCVPSHDLVHADFTTSLAGMLRSTPMSIQLLYVSSRSSIVAHARNLCVEKALELGADYLLFLDSDLTFPADTLVRLYGYFLHMAEPSCAAVGATYRRRSEPYEVMGLCTGGNTGEPVAGYVEMDVLPTGCLMLRASAFDSARPWFRYETVEATGQILGEDLIFCNRLRAQGKRLMLDVELSADLQHIGLRYLNTEVAP